MNHFEKEIESVKQELQAVDGSDYDGRVKAIIITKLEEAALWASKLIKTEPV